MRVCWWISSDSLRMCQMAAFVPKESDLLRMESQVCLLNVSLMADLFSRPRHLQKYLP